MGALDLRRRGRDLQHQPARRGGAAAVAGGARGALPPAGHRPGDAHPSQAPELAPAGVVEGPGRRGHQAAHAGGGDAAAPLVEARHRSRHAGDRRARSRALRLRHRRAGRRPGLVCCRVHAAGVRGRGHGARGGPAERRRRDGLGPPPHPAHRLTREASGPWRPLLGGGGAAGLREAVLRSDRPPLASRELNRVGARLGRERRGGSKCPCLLAWSITGAARCVPAVALSVSRSFQILNPHILRQTGLAT